MKFEACDSCYEWRYLRVNSTVQTGVNIG